MSKIIVIQSDYASVEKTLKSLFDKEDKCTCSTWKTVATGVGKN